VRRFHRFSGCCQTNLHFAEFQGSTCAYSPFRLSIVGKMRAALLFCARSPLFPLDGTHEHPRNEPALQQATGDARNAGAQKTPEERQG
jgi:hypothetical protein